MSGTVESLSRLRNMSYDHPYGGPGTIVDTEQNLIKTDSPTKLHPKIFDHTDANRRITRTPNENFSDMSDQINQIVQVPTIPHETDGLEDLRPPHGYSAND